MLTPLNDLRLSACIREFGAMTSQEALALAVDYHTSTLGMSPQDGAYSKMLNDAEWAFAYAELLEKKENQS